MQTLRKLPITAPKIKVKTYTAAGAEEKISSIESFIGSPSCWLIRAHSASCVARYSAPLCKGSCRFSRIQKATEGLSVCVANEICYRALHDCPWGTQPLRQGFALPPLLTQERRLFCFAKFVALQQPHFF